jgi:hypothetical protein
MKKRLLTFLILGVVFMSCENSTNSKSGITLYVPSELVGKWYARHTGAPYTDTPVLDSPILTFTSTTLSIGGGVSYDIRVEGNIVYMVMDGNKQVLYDYQFKTIAEYEADLSLAQSTGDEFLIHKEQSDLDNAKAGKIDCSFHSPGAGITISLVKN